MKNTKKGLKKYIGYKDGKIWFSKEAEKKFFFFMTIFMLVIGIAYMLAGL